MQASSFFAKEAQSSTKNMEKMTQNMQKVANRTQQEAISMRVITLVTLFFLPATSIAVSSECYPILLRSSR
jgi:inosine/xanthosine triphosphate pyrophosphatase family protein